MRGWLVALAACSSPPRPASVAVEPPQPAAPRTDPTLATVVGRVLLDGKPVPAFAIQLGEWQPSQRIRSVSGRFSITTKPDFFDVILTGPNFATARLVSKEVGAGEVLDLGDVVVRHGFTVEGHVHDAAGKPVEGATVSVEPWVPERTEAWDRRTTRSDARGVYRLTEVSAGGAMVATVDDRMTSNAREVGPGIVDLVVVEGGAIDASSEVPGLVSILPIAGSMVFRLAERLENVFRFDNLVPGDYTVYVHPERGTAAPSEQRVTVVANQRARVKLLAPATPIQIRITTSLPCREVILEGPNLRDWRHIAEQSCDDGHATIEGVTPGRYRACDADDCKPITVLTSPAQQAFDLR